MATYGIDIYGSGVKYGPSVREAFEATGFYGTPTPGTLVYGDWTIYWTAPGGTYSDFRLVRNFLNIPSDEEDGSVVSTNAFAGSVREPALPQGGFVYYSMFIYDTEWHRAGNLTILVDKDWGYPERLWELTPLFYQARDEALIPQSSLYSGTNPEVLTKGPLRRFYDVIGQQFNHIRTEYESLRLANDVRRTSGGLLPLLAQELGIEYEAELGMHRNRAYIENAVHFYKLKGTKPGIEGISSAITGWDADAVLGLNLMLDIRDADYALGTIGPITSPFGTWHQTSGTTSTFHATTEITEAVSLPFPGYGTTFLRIDGTAGPGSTAVIEAAPIPITGSSHLTISVYEMSSAAGLPTVLGVRYYDAQMNPLSLSTTSLSSGTAWGRKVSAASVPPAGARFAAPYLSYTNETGQWHYLAFWQVETGDTASAYEDPRTIHIKLRADRVNFVVNPSLEYATSPMFGWSAAANCQPLTRVAKPTMTLHTYQGNGSYVGQAQSIAAGQMTFTTAVMPVVEGRRYAGSMYITPAGSTPQLVQCDIAWLNASNSVISISQSEQSLEIPGAFVRPGVVALAPTGAVNAYLIGRIVSTNAAGENHLFEDALFEQAESVKDFFYAGMSSVTGDFLWENNATPNTVPSHRYLKRTIKRARLIEVLSDYLPAAAPYTLEFAKNP